jgi:hypothetical protein
MESIRIPQQWQKRFQIQLQRSIILKILFQNMNDTILRLNKEIENFKGKIEQSEIELKNEKERRSGTSSDSSGSP